jgi:hypothetical protein
MSLVKIQGNASGTGEFTIDAPNSNTNRTLTLPDATGTVVLDTATQTLTNKTLTSPTLTTPNINSAQFATVSGTAPIYGCRAWVNFNGTGTVAIRGSGNVTSITDNNTGDYTVNFTTAMPDVNYMFVAGAQANGVANGPMIDLFAEGTTTTCRFRVFSAASATMDSPVCTFLAVR